MDSTSSPDAGPVSEFDPYYLWLGIPPRDQPPNHYRLLGVELFEPDPYVITMAADQRASHVQSFDGGPHSAWSRAIVDEIAASKAALVNPNEKLAYDAHLRSVAPTDGVSEHAAIYYRWLGILPNGRPPTFYELVGVVFFEGNPNVIALEADRRIAYLAACQSQGHVQLCHRLIREVLAAKMCLLNPQQKLWYDMQLAASMHGGALPAPAPWATTQPPLVQCYPSHFLQLPAPSGTPLTTSHIEVIDVVATEADLSIGYLHAEDRQPSPRRKRRREGESRGIGAYHTVLFTLVAIGLAFALWLYLNNLKFQFIDAEQERQAGEGARQSDNRRLGPASPKRNKQSQSSLPAERSRLDYVKTP